MIPIERVLCYNFIEKMVTDQRDGKRTPAGSALTGVVLDLFWLNSLLATAGDRLVAGLGPAGARWQILGAVAAADGLGRFVGRSRHGSPSSKRAAIINDLHEQGLVAFENNPHHKRAQLVVLMTRKYGRSSRHALAGTLD